MKIIKNLFDSLRPSFEEGGKFERYYTAFEAMETFAFVPDHVTHNGTHIKDAIDLKRTMFLVVIATIPALLFGMWNTGHQHFLALGQFADLGDGMMEKFIFGAIKVLPIVVVSYAVGLGVEFGMAVYKRHSVEEGFLVSGMLIPLIMPVEVPLWMVAVATIFAVVIGKEVFGGTGMNILNPALTARAFLFFAYPTKMSGNSVWVNTTEGTPVDGYTGETLLAQSINSSSSYIDQAGTAYSSVNDTIYAAFMGWIPGSIGETSTFAILIGAAILLITGIGSWRIMLSFLLGGLAMSLLFNLWDVNEFMRVDPILQICMGGFMFGMVFMATDPVSAAQTNMGKWIYGFLAGFLGIMIRVFNPAYPEGVMMGILFMNVMAPLIDHYVIEANIKRRTKRAALAA
ncbi:NADH:ubiquinone reductase (Na(+)-transporting) subunit B [Salibacteraceae bacterium]|jgi:Na+-transporting NADH:ubiquinone oxidoreductase subunit B|nr:NADH:ubiquinone reductase (Na(+)-transporting) subunit B [Flavobacteriales bacterium]MDB9701156.1 NADH:ubiquinone reductase (Na(+)-transporting) subunit B [Salibacteraceae bacterium]